ncbi:Flp pilus assembly complex ATPase component TadA [Sporosarcina sp. ACRSL]|uniref:competence type IV pilus ATPase ComGA n=1 Tax=Sporosarcina sp. ACRSL TaxID=2918215 RepID=UPI001EF6770B|nr:competence type IV pilus ATPase ComGA [Sporosarcina sp. ACRSL]MCG7345141.1 Flp pilus assembly complex ATPase component TadA [Sporosarcina sp. ACRSL]
MEKRDNLIETKSFDLLERAIASESTDIHLVPAQDHYDVYFKKNSKLERSGTFPPQLAARMISFFKFLSSLDISDRRKPQSGSFHKKMQNENYSFRVSTIPSIQMKESVVIRIQRHDQIVSLDKLCIDQQWEEKLRRAAEERQGLILLTGPTGSGKTTTIYSLTAHCVNQLERHVISLEDPVENNHSHLLQIQVNERSGMTYAAGLKAILRHSPDVIMIGEIRDSETARIAVAAALTGHLVLSTVHSKDPEGCFYRMMDFGITPEELRQTVVCIAAQRLIQKKDGSMGAVFEIVQGELLDSIAAGIISGNRVTIPEEMKIDAVAKKYSMENEPSNDES